MMMNAILSEKPVKRDWRKDRVNLGETVDVRGNFEYAVKKENQKIFNWKPIQDLNNQFFARLLYLIDMRKSRNSQGLKFCMIECFD